MEDKKYQIILADPPWSYNDKLGTNSAKMGGYDKYYKGMSLKEICDLSVKDITDKDCILFLWATMPKLPEAFEVIKSWGFTHKTTAFTWIKLNPKAGSVFKGVGRWVQGNAELVLLATKGKPHRITKDVSQVILASRGKHSQKPNVVRNEIVRLMGDIPRIELFARKPKGQLFNDPTFKGWDVMGNDIDGKDIQQSIKELCEN